MSKRKSRKSREFEDCWTPKNVEEGREELCEVEVAYERSGRLIEGGSRNRSNAETQGRDSRLDTSLYMFGSALGAEMKRLLKSAWAREHQRRQKGVGSLGGYWLNGRS
jgi:hypothetical protein